MLLAIDIGNTNIKLGIFKGEDLLGSWRISAASVRTADEYGLYIGNLLGGEGFSLKGVTGIIMSSVIPSLNYTIEHMIRHFMPQAKMYAVTPDLKMNIKLGYENPKELGSDRIVNSAAAYHLYGGPCIVIDFGTATTFNAVDRQGVFLGGCICAGIKLSMEALAGAASKLPYIEIIRPDGVIGRTTAANLQAGAVYGLIGQVEYIVKKFRAVKGFEKAKVVATGGLSEIVAAEEKIIDVIDRTMTLRGLNLLYNLNKE